MATLNLPARAPDAAAALPRAPSTESACVRTLSRETKRAPAVVASHHHHHRHHHHHHHHHHHTTHGCHQHTSSTCAHETTTSTTTESLHKPSGSSEKSAADLQAKVRAIMRSEGTAADKFAKINDLYAEQRRLAISQAPKAHGVFPGAGTKANCKHYARKCWIRAECCQRYYPCRRCHDEAENHEVDRKATQIIACTVCGDDTQPVAPTCRTCGVRFARYFCAPCRLFNDDPNCTAYHCDDCGICRVGRAEDNYHCHKCGSCVPIADAETHPCIERNVDAACPICAAHLGSSTESVLFLPCGHPMHVDCLRKYAAAGHFACPLCSKCIHDDKTMRAWYKQLDERLMLDVIPAAFANRVSRVLCNDCETKTVARFHFRFHKCKDCGGYNTKVLEQYDVDPDELPARVGESETKSESAWDVSPSDDDSQQDKGDRPSSNEASSEEDDVDTGQ